VPPGAVYFLEKADGSAFTAAEFEALWLCALGADCEDGLGRVVPGVWHPPTSQPGIEETP
jgi:CRISPR-associated protein Cmr3